MSAILHIIEVGIVVGMDSLKFSEPLNNFLTHSGYWISRSVALKLSKPWRQSDTHRSGTGGNRVFSRGRNPVLMLRFESVSNK